MSFVNIAAGMAVLFLWVLTKVQGEHKVFPWLQTFITRKLHGIQTYFFLPLLKLVSKILCHVFIV
jgi:hypothetical protein